MAKRPKPIILTVLDGWGYRAETKGNAIALARKPNYDRLLKEFPNTLIHTSGPYVGLPEGQMGNSEVGHLNIGAGRIVQMDITRVDALIASGEFFRQPLLLEAMERGRAHQLHLLGLVSAGGVHSHIEHLFALLRMARENKVQRVFVHCFMDRQDHASRKRHRLPPRARAEDARIRRRPNCQRQRPLLRDGPRQSLGAHREGLHRDGPRRFRSEVEQPASGDEDDYQKGVTDKFVIPAAITTQAAPGKPAAPRGLIRDDDAAIFFNFRADRARQITKALIEPGFDKIADPARLKNLAYVAMTQYEKTWPWLRYILAPEKLEHILANVLDQLH